MTLIEKHQKQTIPSDDRERGIGYWIRRSLLVLVFIILILAVLGAGYQAIVERVDARSYPAPGQRVDVGGYKMHIYCVGEGSPTAILEAANTGTVSNWAWIQPELSKATRTCAYDRADMGWSDLSPQPYDTVQNAEALHTLLSEVGVPPPYVLVGHSFGGLYVRMFAETYPQEVAGMVFIEGTLPDGMNRLGKPDVMPGAPAASMINAAPFISRLGVLRLMGFPATDPDLPEPQRGALQAYLASNKWAESIKREYFLFPTLLGQIRPLYGPGSLGDIPLAIVLGSEGDGGINEWQELFAAQAALSTNHVIVTVPGANHISLVDRRDDALQTTKVILKVIEAARGKGSLAGGT